MPIRIIHTPVQATHLKTPWRYDPSCRQQPGFGVRFVVRNHDTEVRNGDVLVCLRARQTGNQIANDIETATRLSLARTTIQGESGLDVLTSIRSRASV